VSEKAGSSTVCRCEVVTSRVPHFFTQAFFNQSFSKKLRTLFKESSAPFQESPAQGRRARLYSGFDVDRLRSGLF
jgi:hypothetical protein